MFVSHAVYLSPEEIKLLNKGPCTLETMGISVNSTPTKLGEEILCRYLLSNEMSEPIELMPDGFKVYISPKRCKDLLPLPEGSEWLSFSLEQTHKDAKFIHQLVFNKLDVLEKTMVVAEFAFPASVAKETPKKAGDEK